MWQEASLKAPADPTSWYQTPVDLPPLSTLQLANRTGPPRVSVLRLDCDSVWAADPLLPFALKKQVAFRNERGPQLPPARS